ncbi:MAG TPA: heavy metal translocating P-type ATPase [Chloroflexota bacterium]|nr:heavy metal translocating P-type ATPase [Chloroflexota bacterium]
MHDRFGAHLVYQLRVAAVLVGIVAGFGASAAGFPQVSSRVWLVTLVVGGVPILLKTLQGIFEGRFASDIVASLAIIGAGITQEYLAGSVIVLMQTGGETLELFAVQSASKSLHALLARAPQVARRRVGQTMEEIAVEDVGVNDVLIVRAGDIVPVDSLVVSGSSDVDEAALTGEPLPVTKQAGDELMSGSMCLDGALEVRALRTSRNSQYEQIVQLVRQAQTEKAPLSRLADRYAVFFTPATLIMCAAGYAVTRQVDTMVAVLVVATPCPLILATPVAIISGINRAARHGIVVKGGAAIEVIGRTRVFVFDKTGTLTSGRPALDEIVPLDGYTVPELLELTASLEQLSAHPMARAVVEASHRAAVNLHMPTDVGEQAGQGVVGMVEGHSLEVGSIAFAEKQELANLHVLDRAQAGENPVARESSAVIGIDGRVAGIISFADPVRPGLRDLMARLRVLGVVKTVMLTGDNSITAQLIGEEAGISDVRANLLPVDKASAVKVLQQEFGTLAMVGDGINDAPALASATVGIALGARGAAVSADAADIVITTDSLDRVADAVEIGQRTVSIAHQSIWIGLGVSGIMMVIAALGGLVPTAGAVLQEGLDVLVIANALRAR